MRDKTILMTGGAGFIGTHLAERLCGANRIVLFDSFRRNSLKDTTLDAHPNITVVKGNVLDRESVTQALHDVDTVVHLAAVAGVSSYYNESLSTLKVNIGGTMNMLECAVAAGVKRFVDFSTSEVFGPNAVLVDEESMHGIGPVSDRRWVYATSKLAGEHLVLRTGEQHGLHATVLRPFNVYGPRQTGEGAISNFCSAAARGEPLQVYGDGYAVRAWCYVSDMVEAVVLALSTDASAGQTFNIGNPHEIATTVGLARRVAALAPGIRIEQREMARAEVYARIPKIDKAKNLLGFVPKVGLDEGLRNTIDWFKEQPTPCESR